MLFRLLILGALVALVYRAAKTWFGTAQQHQGHSPGGTPQTVDDEMIKDPECGVYFPRRTAVALNHQNREMLYFLQQPMPRPLYRPPVRQGIIVTY